MRGLLLILSTVLLFFFIQGGGTPVQTPETAPSVARTDTSTTIITPTSSKQDTFSLSKHLQFFTPNYRHLNEKYIPAEIADSVYKKRLDSLGKGMAVPLVYNPKVKSYIRAYTNDKRKQLNVMLSLAQYYFPVFEEIFVRFGVPPELKYLAIIESALNPRAMSRVGATGLWQFMYQTGQMYNLKVNPFVDERLDPVKATEAAARYLSDLYRSFGDWTLVLAAYNCGPGNVNKAIRKAGGKTDFWKIYHFLPAETRNYVPAYIGATYAMNYYAEHDIPAPSNDFPMLTDTVIVSKDVDFNTIASTLDLPLQTLRDLNPQYKQDVVLGGTQHYSLRLPVYIIPHYLEMQDTIAQQFEIINREITLTYRIKQHETLSGIAARFDVTVKDLMTWNKLKSTTIYPNQTLQIHTTQKALETIRSRPKTAQAIATAMPTAGNVTLLSSTTTKSKPTSSRKDVASHAVSAVTVAADELSAGSAASAATPQKPADKQTVGQAQPNAAARPATSQTQRPATTQTAGQAQPNAARPATSQTQRPATTQTAGQAQPNAARPATPQTQRPATAQTQPATARPTTTQTQTPAPPARLPKGTVVSYKVRRGDTLYAIMRRYPGSNLKEIIRQNNLAANGNLIMIGQVLKITIN
ncbi:MAG: transglycosylase SLT domain-containing protein [Bacteroidales bacterium]|jgi:membrane-bound lytic murein transglycosylase D|nr:transglycosylase SLT domain-containing protein [Bacteroidales bacterium]